MPSEAPGAPAGRQLYIYYRVAGPDLGACVAAVRALQADLRRAHPELRCELLQRPEADDAGRRTLMEIYASPGGVDGALQAHIAQAAATALALLVVEPRHVEVFEPCA